MSSLHPHPLTAVPQLTVAAATLLLAARRSPDSWHTVESLERLLHNDLRYSHVGPDSRSVTPLHAFRELHERHLIDGTPDRWCTL